MSKNSRLIAEGIPAKATAIAMYLTASFLSQPIPTKLTTQPCNVETIEVNAAKDIARKKILPMTYPAVPIDANSAVRCMNVKPDDPDSTASRPSAVVSDSAKTVLRTATPAINETKLIHNPVKHALSLISSFFLIATAYVIAILNLSHIDQAD